MQNAVKFGEIIILDVPFGSIAKVVGAAARFAGKNCHRNGERYASNNPLSSTERIQAMIPETKVIKAFNHVFAQIIADEMTQRTIAFIVSGDKVAKTTVKPIIESIGFDVINVGCAKKPCISIISCASSSTWARTLHSS